jgi:N-acetylmuramoyl-L-alanine amidase
MAQVNTSSLRVHTGPSLAATVVTSLPRGAHVQVLVRRNGWVEIRLSNGTEGWVSAAYVGSRSTRARSVPAVSYTPAATVTKRVVKTTRLSTARVAINVHTGPSLDDAVTTVLVPGTGYRVIGWSQGWAHVVLANGQRGWVNGTVMQGAPTAYATYSTHQSKHVTRAQSASSGQHVLTAGVRMHSAPGVKSPVTGLAAAGTHVRILGSRGGWDLIRLPGGKTGYVDGIYVH